MTDDSYQRLCFKWCLILPASHIPLADIIILAPGCSLRAIDSSGVIVNINSSKSNGCLPDWIYFLVSSSKQSILSLKISVALIASGESTYTGMLSKNFTSSGCDSLYLFKSYISSCVLPTANDE